MSVFRFTKSPNPCPAPPHPPMGKNPVTWVTEGYETDAVITWASGDDKVATVKWNTATAFEATVEATGLGMTTITATQHLPHGAQVIQEIVGYVFVGDLFTYQGTQILHAQSQTWNVMEAPPGCPSWHEMKQRESGVAWVPEAEDHPAYVVLSFDELHKVRGSFKEDFIYFSAEPQGSRGTQAMQAKVRAYAWAPDGNRVWGVDASVWADPPQQPPTAPKFPEEETMRGKGASLAWMPPWGFPKTEGPDHHQMLIAAVTCFVLDPGVFPAPADTGTTFYKIHRLLGRE